MNRCTVIGHDWYRLMKHIPDYNRHTWECRRCRQKAVDYVKPNRWTWLMGYPLGSTEVNQRGEDASR